MTSSPSIITQPLTREQVREVDQRALHDYEMNGLVLMENAGRGVVEVLQSVAPGRDCAILCGKGNNAGDGFVVARHLQLLGWPVRIILVGQPDELQGDALANWKIVQKAEVRTVIETHPDRQAFTEHLRDSEVILDCLLGTGAQGDPRSPMAQAIEAANACQALRVAVDIPSGLDCDSGQPGTPCFRADHTCTFVAPKTGFAKSEAHAVLGQVHVVGIGVPRPLLQSIQQQAQ